MKSNKDIIGPVSVAFILNKELNDQVEHMAIAPSTEQCLQIALSNCMQSSVTTDGMGDKRVLEYEISDFDLVPMPTPENCTRYYREMLLPVVNKLGLKPTLEIHSKEVVFAIMNDIPIEVGNPEN